jgi:ATP-dependent helicase/nuclease subunit A
VALDAALGVVVRGLDGAEESPDGEPMDEPPGGQNLGWAAHRDIERREEDDESLRLLYVAVTRARDALVLSAGVDLARAAKSRALELIGARFDRVTGLAHDPAPEADGRPLAQVIDTPPMPLPRTAGDRLRSDPRLRLAQLIERSAARGVIEPPRPVPPRCVRLDPADPREAWLQRALESPLALDPATVTQALEVLRACADWPLEPASLEVILAAWTGTELAARIARAPRRVPGLDWSLRLRGADDEDLDLHGRLQWWFQESPDASIAMVVGGAGEETAQRVLRLHAGCLALERAGWPRVTEAWSLTLEPDGLLARRHEPGLATLDRLLSRLRTQ